MRQAAFLLLLAAPLMADDITLVRGSLAKLAKGGPTAAKEAEKNGTVDALLMRMPVSGSPWRAKYLAAEWLLRAAALRAGSGDTATLPATLEKGWDLIWSAIGESRQLKILATGPVYRGSDAARRSAAAQAVNESIEVQKVAADQAEAMASVALETAVRLQDSGKMSLVLGEFEDRTKMSDRDRAYAYIASCHAGRWDLATKWSADLAKGGRILPAFHESSLNQPESFDYSVIPEWIKLAEPAAGGAAPASSRFQVKHYRLRLKSVEGPGAQAIREAFASGWQDRSDLDNPLLRLGALGHWLRPGARPMPLTGGASASSLDLFGKLELPGGVRRSERLQVRAGDEGKPWAGSLRVETVSTTGERLSAEFELEMVLGVWL